MSREVTGQWMQLGISVVAQQNPAHGDNVVRFVLFISLFVDRYVLIKRHLWPFFANFFIYLFYQKIKSFLG